VSVDDLLTIAPFAAGVGVAIAILITDLVAPGRRGAVVAVSLIGLALVALLTITTGFSAGELAGRRTAFGDGYVVDGLTTFLDLLFVSIVAFTIVFAPDYL
jgi:NADH:ubiquinone oxidoreductase subunit 2 (subunit N)